MRLFEIGREEKAVKITGILKPRQKVCPQTETVEESRDQL